MRFSFVIICRSVLNVWPETALLLPVGPRDAKRLDTPENFGESWERARDVQSKARKDCSQLKIKKLHQNLQYPASTLWFLALNGTYFFILTLYIDLFSQTKKDFNNIFVRAYSLKTALVACCNVLNGQKQLLHWCVQYVDMFKSHPSYMWTYCNYDGKTRKIN